MPKFEVYVNSVSNTNRTFIVEAANSEEARLKYMDNNGADATQIANRTNQQTSIDIRQTYSPTSPGDDVGYGSPMASPIPLF
jgi:hypothetical protein